MSRENWGRWGEHDEIGALNLVGADEILAATALVRQGKVASLAQPLSKTTPVPSHRTGLLHFMDRDGGDYAAGARSVHGFQFAEDSVVMPLHLGTHIDGLCHAWCEDQLYNGHANTEITSTHGAKKCGVDKLPPIVTRGVLLDVAKQHGSPLPDGYSIGIEELKKTAEHDKRGYDINFNEEPGIDVSAALWLANSGAVMVGADNYAIEAMPFPEGTIFPVHQRLIRDHGISLLEGLALQEFAQLGIHEFLFVAAPLPIVGGTGSPITPLALY